MYMKASLDSIVLQTRKKQFYIDVIFLQLKNLKKLIITSTQHY